MPVLPTVARYTFKVLNASRVPQGTIKGVKAFVAVKRFNAVGNWGITCDAADPINQLLLTPGYNLECVRTVYDQRTGIVKSAKSVVRGPMLHADMDSETSLIGATGADENIWLAARRAVPVNEIYYRTVTAAVGSLLRWYRMIETSGTQTTDTKSAQHGTYSGGFTLNQPYLPDIGGGSVLFDGTGHSVIPTTSLPTVNAAWSMSIWFILNALNAGNSTLLAWGTSAAKQSAAIKLDNTGAFFADVNGSGTAHVFTPAFGTLHQAWATWDGTTLSFYIDGALVNTATPGALNITLTYANIASYNGNEKFKGYLGSAEIYNAAVNLATIQASYNSGLTRHSKQSYSIRTGNCETALRAYVDDNCTSNAVVDEQGLARAVPGLTLASNGSHGTNVKGSARFDPFIMKDGSGLLQRLALQGGDIGYRVDASGANMLFQVYQPNDRSATVKFGDKLGGVSSFRVSRDAPDWESGGNYLLLAGGGEDIARTFQSVQDSSSESAWGRFEAFQDARDLATRDDLLGRGNQSLPQYSDVESVKCTPIQGQNTVWQVDWDLGDIVTVRASDISVVDKVRAVELELDGNVEKVTPRIGAPGTEYSDTQDVVLTSGKYTDLKVHARLSALEARK